MATFELSDRTFTVAPTLWLVSTTLNRRPMNMNRLTCAAVVALTEVDGPSSRSSVMGASGAMGRLLALPPTVVGPSCSPCMCK